MDAKTELERKLVGLAPGMEAEIRQVLEAYRITWAETGGALALRERIESFLAAKRIDGLSQKTLKDYGLVLRSFARYADKPPEEITADDVRRYLAGLSEQALQGGMPLPVIQQLLGHEDPKTTMIYAAILPEAARRAYRKTFDRKENDHE